MITLDFILCILLVWEGRYREAVLCVGGMLFALSVFLLMVSEFAGDEFLFNPAISLSIVCFVYGFEPPKDTKLILFYLSQIVVVISYILWTAETF